MPNPNINQYAVPFSSENQPENRRRSMKTFSTLMRELLERPIDMIVEGEEVGSGRRVKVKIRVPTQEVLVSVLLRKAASGDMVAMKEVFDRTEGKVRQPISIEDKRKVTVNFTE